MKFVKKILLSVAAISAVTAIAAVSASAAMTATYNEGQVALDGIETQAAQKTLLILSEDATDISGEKAAVFTADGPGIIVQIDQNTEFATVPVGELPAGTYYVRVGGDAQFEQAEFTVGGGKYQNPNRLVGDVVKDDTIDMVDASKVVEAYLGSETLTGDDLAAADAKEDGEVDMVDASEIVNYYLGDESSALGTKTLADRTVDIQ